MKMPNLYIPHGGGPCFFMEWTMGPPDTWQSMAAWLSGLGATLPALPKGVVVVSAHWEEPVFTVSAMAQPNMIYDYYGFPPHTYELQYPAPGSPDIAERVWALLRQADLPCAINRSRGFDHGVFVPALLIFPEATIPIVPLSLKASLDPNEHLAVGRALRGLRDEGILILGSGMSSHNLRSFADPRMLPASRAFDDWLTLAVEQEPVERWRRLVDWESGSHARLNHEREEHLIPLMVAAGAADDGEVARKIFSDQVLMTVVSGFRFG